MKNLISDSSLPDVDRSQLLSFLEKLPIRNMRLPRIIQHGDLTLDNILLSGNKLCIVDYDYVGITDVPGFDLFGLFRRYNNAGVRRLCEEYLPEYFKKIGAEVDGGDYKGLVFFYYLAELILRKPHLLKNMSAQRVISDFEKIYS